MASQRPARIRREWARFALQVDVMEERELLAAAVPGVTLDPLLVPKFVNPLPKPLDPGFVYRPSPGTTDRYEVGVYQIEQDLGLGLTSNGQPTETTVYGYGTSAATATYPGRTFEVQSNRPIAVHWTNGLVDSSRKPLAPILPVDTTLLDPKMTALGGLSKIGVPIVTHLHGGHTEAASDGTPMQWYTPLNDPGGQPLYRGDDYVKDTFTYDNTQQAATLWYHDHAMGVTRLNVEAGLAGFYIVHDANEDALVAAHKLPGKPYDIPLAIQDRMFYGPGVADNPATPWREAPGQLYYPSAPPTPQSPSPSIQPEFFGDVVMVNGKAWPVLDVEPRMYRFRVLDGSDSRFYNLRVFDKATGVNQTFFQVGTDDGLLPAPVALTQLLVAPGERADVVVDFSKLAGKTLILTNDAKGPFPMGSPVDPKTTGQVMAFRVSLPKDAAVPDTVLPAKLNTIAPLPEAAVTRDLALYEGLDQYGRLIQKLGTLSGPKDFDAPITEVIRQGDTEVWRIYNTTADTHPIHLHQVSLQVISRQKFNWKTTATGGIVVTGLTGKPASPAANEAGWKDTVRMNPGEVTVIKARFDLPGKYVWHCHILSHEEHDMMRFFRVEAPLAPSGATSTSFGALGSGTAVSTGSQLIAEATPPPPVPVTRRKSKASPVTP